MLEDERIITSMKDEEEVDVENSLRPTSMADYVGQEKVKNNLDVYIQAAKKRGEALDHVLLYGPPGLGKTTLSHIIANELGSSLKITSGPAIEKVADLASILTNLNKHDVKCCPYRDSWSKILRTATLTGDVSGTVTLGLPSASNS